MAHVIAPDYGQQFLLPPALEDWVAAEHPARFLREFVDQLDLAALGFVIPAASEGRPPYAPSLLLKIWLYGYFFRIRSTRRLETACGEVLPLIWLCGLLRPDHNSLWRFWRDNRKALRQVFKQTVQLALRTGAVGLALQAVDGTKIAAAASDRTGWSRERMQELLSALDAALEQTELKVQEENEAAAANPVHLPAGLAQRQALRAQIKAGLAQLRADQRGHYHPVEPEARVMKCADTHRFAYNAQAVVDAQDKILVACEVSRQETDRGQLVPMVTQAQENLGVAAANPTTLADSGYGAGADLQAAADQQLSVLVAPLEGKPARNNPYATQHFHYDRLNRTVKCPRGVTLEYEGHTQQGEQRIERYRCHAADCPVRAQCTRDPKGRRIEVRPHTPVVQAMRAQLQSPGGGALYQQRAVLIEPRFGQIKQHEGFRRWTVWGLEGVRTQWALVCASWNLRVLWQRWRAAQGPGRQRMAAIALKVGQVVAKAKPWLPGSNPSQLLSVTTA
ncbi:MAG: IS1182 family transposase, partial [Bacteroidota bacterium]|nr:IS1182 family transposase [Bacteroidota bacterium]